MKIDDTKLEKKCYSRRTVIKMKPTTKFIVRNIQAICLIGLTYWALNEEINYTLIISSFCFLCVANISAFFENRLIEGRN
jgi:hypothetical protein